jgi:hypothetical protein
MKLKGLDGTVVSKDQKGNHGKPHSTDENRNLCTATLVLFKTCIVCDFLEDKRLEIR